MGERGAAATRHTPSLRALSELLGYTVSVLRSVTIFAGVGEGRPAGSVAEFVSIQ